MKAALLVFFALPLLAEPPKPPQPTSTEQLAIAQLHSQMVQVEQNIDRFEAEYTKAHPGWQINVRTGQPEAIPEPKAEAKPEVKK